MSSAVITGCGRGIGRAILERLAADGYDVVGLERDEGLAAETETAVPDATVVVGDAAEPSAHDQAALQATALSPLVAWVNNASLLDGGGALHEAEVAIIEGILAVNLSGYIWGCAAALRSFARQRSGGAIVNISSVHGRAGYSGYCAYDPAKGGVDALTRYVAVEYGPVGVRANAIAPGGVLTEGARSIIARSDDPAQTLLEIADQNPLRKIAEPAEIAAVAAFLVSDGASFLTGQSIAVDGGLTAACMPFPLDPSIAAAYGLPRAQS
jgi:NAD(P)-dependent dehydrogenase (short-subunit alcohol dehydrogenase family)